MRNPSSSVTKNPTTTPCCIKIGIKKGPWTPEEDELLSNHIKKEGEGRWRTLPKRAGLLRCGKSCRLRWMNYLRPSIKHGRIAADEEDLILRLHRLLGNRWSLIAGRIPGRTDNEIKNYWNTHLSKKLISQGIDPRNHKPLKNLDARLPSNPKPILEIPSSSEIEEETTYYNNEVVNKDDDDDIIAIDNFMMGLPSNQSYGHGGCSNNYGGDDYVGEDTFSSFLDSLVDDSFFGINHHQQQQQQQQQLEQQQLEQPINVSSSAQTIWEAAMPMVGLGDDQQRNFNNNIHNV